MHLPTQHRIHTHTETLNLRGRPTLVFVVSCIGCLHADPDSNWWQASTNRERRDDMMREFDHTKTVTSRD